MKKQIVAVLIAVLLVLPLVFVACDANLGHTKNLTDKPLNATMVADYTKDVDAKAETFASGSKGFSWENGDPFNVWWQPENVSYEGGQMSLSLSEMKEKETSWDAETSSQVPCAAEYYGAEERSNHYYGYGDFQVRMKPAKITGTASTFFVCTGPYDVWYNEDGTEKSKNSHDEIDIEFLGKDTTKVQFNFFANGKGGHEYMYNLGFDASEEYHDYGFRWTAEDITWFVDEKPVYKIIRAELPKGEAWPETPGRLIMNYWCGTKNAQAWMGKFNDDYSGHAYYEWVKCSAEAQPDPISSKPGVTPTPTPDPGTDPVDELVAPTTGWTDVQMGQIWVSDATAYTVTAGENGVNVTHSKALTGWKCFGASLSESYSWVKMHVKNNSENAVNLVVDIKKEGGDNGVKGVVTNEHVIYNAAEARFTVVLGANEETDVVVAIKDMYIDQIVMFLNSTDANMAAAGDITITELVGIVSDAEKPDPTPTPDPNPEVPDGEWANLNLSAFDGWGKYVVSKTDGITISHTAAIETYGCCGADITIDKAVVKVVVKNNSATEQAYVKICIKNDKQEKGALISATVNGEELGYVEYGALAIIQAGEEATIVMVLDLSKAPDKFVVSMNSEGDATMPTSGNITIVSAQVASADSSNEGE